MAITVSRLCADRTLGLTVVAGAAGADRMISWAHTSELADPTPWLEGGELLMTLALNLDPHPAGQFAYVERLARAGVAALAVDTGMIHPVVPPDSSPQVRAWGSQCWPCRRPPRSWPSRELSSRP